MSTGTELEGNCLRRPGSTPGSIADDWQVIITFAKIIMFIKKLRFNPGCNTTGVKKYVFSVWILILLQNIVPVVQIFRCIDLEREFCDGTGVHVIYLLRTLLPAMCQFLTFQQFINCSHVGGCEIVTFYTVLCAMLFLFVVTFVLFKINVWV